MLVDVVTKSMCTSQNLNFVLPRYVEQNKIAEEAILLRDLVYSKGSLATKIEIFGCDALRFLPVIFA